MKWVDEAGLVWHRLWSMRLMILTTIYTTAAGAWALLPADWQPDLSEGVKALLAGIGVALPAIAAVSRMVAQPKLEANREASKQTDEAGA
jgi:hypothetical protein